MEEIKFEVLINFWIGKVSRYQPEFLVGFDITVRKKCYPWKMKILVFDKYPHR